MNRNKGAKFKDKPTLHGRAEHRVRSPPSHDGKAGKKAKTTLDARVCSEEHPPKSVSHASSAPHAAMVSKGQTFSGMVTRSTPQPPEKVPEAHDQRETSPVKDLISVFNNDNLTSIFNTSKDQYPALGSSKMPQNLNSTFNTTSKSPPIPPETYPTKEGEISHPQSSKNDIPPPLTSNNSTLHDNELHMIPESGSAPSVVRDMEFDDLVRENSQRDDELISSNKTPTTAQPIQIKSDKLKSNLNQSVSSESINSLIIDTDEDSSNVGTLNNLTKELHPLSPGVKPPRASSTPLQQNGLSHEGGDQGPSPSGTSHTKTSTRKITQKSQPTTPTAAVVGHLSGVDTTAAEGNTPPDRIQRSPINKEIKFGVTPLKKVLNLNSPVRSDHLPLASGKPSKTRPEGLSDQLPLQIPPSSPHHPQNTTSSSPPIPILEDYPPNRGQFIPPEERSQLVTEWAADQSLQTSKTLNKLKEKAILESPGNKCILETPMNTAQLEASLGPSYEECNEMDTDPKLVEDLARSVSKLVGLASGNNAMPPPTQPFTMGEYDPFAPSFTKNEIETTTINTTKSIQKELLGLDENPLVITQNELVGLELNPLLNTQTQPSAPTTQKNTLELSEKDRQSTPNKRELSSKRKDCMDSSIDTSQEAGVTTQEGKSPPLKLKPAKKKSKGLKSPAGVQPMDTQEDEKDPTSLALASMGTEVSQSLTDHPQGNSQNQSHDTKIGRNNRNKKNKSKAKSYMEPQSYKKNRGNRHGSPGNTRSPVGKDTIPPIIQDPHGPQSPTTPLDTHPPTVDHAKSPSKSNSSPAKSPQTSLANKSPTTSNNTPHHKSSPSSKKWFGAPVNPGVLGGFGASSSDCRLDDPNFSTTFTTHMVLSKAPPPLTMTTLINTQTNMHPHPTPDTTRHHSTTLNLPVSSIPLPPTPLPTHNRPNHPRSQSLQHTPPNIYPTQKPTSLHRHTPRPPTTLPQPRFHAHLQPPPHPLEPHIPGTLAAEPQPIIDHPYTLPTLTTTPTINHTHTTTLPTHHPNHQFPSPPTHQNPPKKNNPSINIIPASTTTYHLPGPTQLNSDTAQPPSTCHPSIPPSTQTTSTNTRHTTQPDTHSSTGDSHTPPANLRWKDMDLADLLEEPGYMSRHMLYLEPPEDARFIYVTQENVEEAITMAGLDPIKKSEIIGRSLTSNSKGGKVFGFLLREDVRQKGVALSNEGQVTCEAKNGNRNTRVTLSVYGLSQTTLRGNIKNLPLDTTRTQVTQFLYEKIAPGLAKVGVTFSEVKRLYAESKHLGRVITNNWSFVMNLEEFDQRYRGGTANLKKEIARRLPSKVKLAQSRPFQAIMSYEGQDYSCYKCKGNHKPSMCGNKPKNYCRDCMLPLAAPIGELKHFPQVLALHKKICPGQVHPNVLRVESADLDNFFGSTSQVLHEEVFEQRVILPWNTALRMDDDESFNLSVANLNHETLGRELGWSDDFMGYNFRRVYVPPELTYQYQKSSVLTTRVGQDPKRRTVSGPPRSIIQTRTGREALQEALMPNLLSSAENMTTPTHQYHEKNQEGGWKNQRNKRGRRAGSTNHQTTIMPQESDILMVGKNGPQTSIERYPNTQFKVPSYIPGPSSSRMSNVLSNLHVMAGYPSTDPPRMDKLLQITPQSQMTPVTPEMPGSPSTCSEHMPTSREGGFIPHLHMGVGNRKGRAPEITIETGPMPLTNSQGDSQARDDSIRSPPKVSRFTTSPFAGDLPYQH